MGIQLAMVGLEDSAPLYEGSFQTEHGVASAGRPSGVVVMGDEGGNRERGIIPGRIEKSR